MASVILPFAEQPNQRDFHITSASTKDQRLISALVTPYKNGMYVEKRPGWLAQETIVAGKLGNCVYMSPATGDRIHVFETSPAPDAKTAYRNAAGAFSVGSGLFWGVTETKLAGTTTYLFSTATGAYYNDFIGSSGQITDVDFPGPISVLIPLDGYLFVLASDGDIHNSDLNSITAWSATNFIPTNLVNDFPRGLAIYKNYIIAFSTASMEVFYNAGNPVGSPLARYDQAASNVGVANTASPGSVTSAPLVQNGNVICWLGGLGGTSQHVGIYTLDNLNPKKISTPYIDRKLTGKSATLDLFEFEGQLYLHVAITTSDPKNHTGYIGSYLYSFTTESWEESGFHTWLRICSHGGKPLAVDYDGTDGKSFLFGDDAADTIAWRDDVSSSYTMTIQMDKWDAGTNKRKFLDRIELLGSDIQASGTTTLEISVDDYTTFTTVGTFDNTVINPYLMNCGSFVGAAAFRITHSANTAWRAKGLKIYYRVERATKEESE